jgi:hypothetical protein
MHGYTRQRPSNADQVAIKWLAVRHWSSSRLTTHRRCIVAFAPPGSNQYTELEANHQPQSVLSATAGSTRETRRAGTMVASTAAMPSVIAATA